MDPRREETIKEPGNYLHFETPLTKEQMEEIQDALGQFGMATSFIEIKRNPYELLDFDQEKAGVKLGEMSKEDFIALGIRFNPASRNVPTRTYNTLLRNQWVDREDHEPFINPHTEGVDLDMLYEYVQADERLLIGGADIFQNTIVQILNHRIEELHPEA